MGKQGLEQRDSMVFAAFRENRFRKLQGVGSQDLLSRKNGYGFVNCLPSSFGSGFSRENLIISFPPHKKEPQDHRNR